MCEICSTIDKADPEDIIRILIELEDKLQTVTAVQILSEKHPALRGCIAAALLAMALDMAGEKDLVEELRMSIHAWFEKASNRAEELDAVEP